MYYPERSEGIGAITALADECGGIQKVKLSSSAGGGDKNNHWQPPLQLFTQMDGWYTRHQLFLKLNICGCHLASKNTEMQLVIMHEARNRIPSSVAKSTSTCKWVIFFALTFSLKQPSWSVDITQQSITVTKSWEVFGNSPSEGSRCTWIRCTYIESVRNQQMCLALCSSLSG